MFSSITEYYNAELQKLISNESTTLERVLQLPHIVTAFQQDFPNVHQFFCQRARQLLKIVFTDSKSSISTHAFQILSLNSPDLLNIILSNDIFRDAATDMLAKPNIPEYLLGRLSSITYAALIALPKEATQSAGFIYTLIHHSQNPSVFNFFESICSPDDRLIETHKWLIQMGFYEYILRELRFLKPAEYLPDHEKILDFIRNSTKSTTKIPSNDPESSQKSDAPPEPEEPIPEDKLNRTIMYYDPTYFTAQAMYTLIARSTKNPILASSYYNKETIDTLSVKFINEPPFITNARWNAIYSVTCSETKGMMENPMKEAIEILSQPFEKLHSYRVTALKFLTSMMMLEPQTFNVLMKSNILQLVTGIILQFPNSSILHSAIRDFVSVGLQKTDFAVRMVTLYTPVLIESARDRNNRVLGSTAIQIIKMFAEQGLKDPLVKKALIEGTEFLRYYNREMKNYLQVCDSNYGGEIPANFIKVFKALFQGK